MSMLIESDWGDLECVLWHSSTGVVEHWYRAESDPNHPWYRTAVITTSATGPGCLIQSTPIAPNTHGDFQVVVPEDNNLIHYWRDNTNGSDQTWYKGTVISNKAMGPGSMIQSSYGTPDNPGNFEVVVPEGTVGDHSYSLVHYSRNNSVQNTPWSGPTTIMTNASGGAALIQSTYGIDQHPGNFEVVVPTAQFNGNGLDHYFRDNSNMTWSLGAHILSAVNFGGTSFPSLIQSQYDRVPPNPANFEVITTDSDANLIHLFRDNSSSKMPWHITATIVQGSGGPNALVESTYGQSGYPPNFEVITVPWPNKSNPDGGYQHFYRINAATGLPWYAGPVITGSFYDSSRRPTKLVSEAGLKGKLSPLHRTDIVHTPPIELRS